MLRLYRRLNHLFEGRLSRSAEDKAHPQRKFGTAIVLIRPDGLADKGTRDP